MRNLCLGVTVLSLLLTANATAQVTAPKMGQVPKRVTVKPPQLEMIKLAVPELVVADLGGNGIDLSGAVRTSLVTGSAAGMRWVKPQSDQALVVVNATTLRESGFSLATAAGVPLDGSLFPRGGLRGTDPSGAAFIISNAVDLLARLDGNRDGRLDPGDPAWRAIALFRDRDADGTIGPGELTPAGDVLRSFNVAASGSESADAHGTRSTPGTAHLRDGSPIATAHAKPAAID